MSKSLDDSNIVFTSLRPVFDNMVHGTDTMISTSVLISNYLIDIVSYIFPLIAMVMILIAVYKVTKEQNQGKEQLISVSISIIVMYMIFNFQGIREYEGKSTYLVTDLVSDFFKVSEDFADALLYKLLFNNEDYEYNEDSSKNTYPTLDTNINTFWSEKKNVTEVKNIQNKTLKSHSNDYLEIYKNLYNIMREVKSHKLESITDNYYKETSICKLPDDRMTATTYLELNKNKYSNNVKRYFENTFYNKSEKEIPSKCIFNAKKYKKCTYQSYKSRLKDEYLNLMALNVTIGVEIEVFNNKKKSNLNLSDRINNIKEIFNTIENYGVTGCVNPKKNIDNLLLKLKDQGKDSKYIDKIKKINYNRIATLNKNIKKINYKFYNLKKEGKYKNLKSVAEGVPVDLNKSNIIITSLPPLVQLLESGKDQLTFYNYQIANYLNTLDGDCISDKNNRNCKSDKPTIAINNTTRLLQFYFIQLLEKDQLVKYENSNFKRKIEEIINQETLKMRLLESNEAKSKKSKSEKNTLNNITETFEEEYGEMFKGNKDQPVEMHWTDLGRYYTVLKIANSTEIKDFSREIEKKYNSKTEKSIKALLDDQIQLMQFPRTYRKNNHDAEDYISKENKIQEYLRYGVEATVIAKAGFSGLTNKGKGKKFTRGSFKVSAKDMIKDSLKGSFLLMIIPIILIVLNFVLPSLLWFIAVISWYLKTSIMIALLPINFFLLMFQAKKQIVYNLGFNLLGQALIPLAMVVIFFVIMEFSIIIEMNLNMMLPFFDEGFGLTETAAGSFLSGFGMSDEYSLIPFIVSAVKQILILLINTMLYMQFFKASEYVSDAIGEQVRTDAIDGQKILDKTQVGKHV
jgi:hypothetical protein